MMRDSETFITKHKLTLNEALESINFILKMIVKIKPEQEALAEDTFPNIGQIRRKKNL